MTLVTYPDIIQGTPQWDDARRGMVTASAVGQLLTVAAPDATAVACPTCGAEVDGPCISAARKTPTPIKTFHDTRAAQAATLPPVYRTATGDTAKGLMLTLAAERITGHTEEMRMTDDMVRGLMDEPRATAKYAEHFAVDVVELGFMHRDIDGVRIGYSPDGLVGDGGCIEIKSRRQKKHLKTVLDDAVPGENMAQIQCALLVSGRAWCDYVSWSGGMAMWTKRVLPDPDWHAAIVAAVVAFEESAAQMLATYAERTNGLPMTERADAYESLVV
jgi:hypothetical protein